MRRPRRPFPSRFLLLCAASLCVAPPLGRAQVATPYWFVASGNGSNTSKPRPTSPVAAMNDAWESALSASLGPGAVRSVSFETGPWPVLNGTASGQYTDVQGGVRTTFSKAPDSAGNIPFFSNGGIDGNYGLTLTDTTGGNRKLIVDFNGSLVKWIGFHVYDLDNNSSSVKISGISPSGVVTQLHNFQGEFAAVAGQNTADYSWTFVGISSTVAFSRFKIETVGGNLFSDLYQYAISVGERLQWNAAAPSGLVPSGGNGVWNGGSLANTHWLTDAADGARSPIAFFDGKQIDFGGLTGGTVTLDISGHDPIGGFKPSGIYFTPTGDATTYVIGASPDNGIISPQAGAFIDVQRDATIRARIATAFEKTGLARLTIEGTNSATAAVRVTHGILQIGAGGAAGSQDSDIINNSQVVVNRSADWVYDKVMSGTGTLDKQGSGALILTRSNTYTGLTTITGGRLDLGNGGLLGSVAGDINNGGLLRFHRADSYTFDKVISGSGFTEKLGAGVLTFTGEHTFEGLTTVKGGTLRVGNGGTIGSIMGDVAVENGTFLEFNNAGAKAYVGSVSGAGALRKDGPGTLSLGGTSSYSGLTQVLLGILEVKAGGALGASGAASSTEVSSVATVQFRDGLITSEHFAIAGTGDLGAGALRNVSDDNQVRGTVTLADHATIRSAVGKLELWSVAGSGKNLTVNSGADAGTVHLSQSLNLGAGRLVKDGAGTLQVDAVSAFTGGLLVRRGEFIAGNLTAFGQGGTVEVGEEGGALAPVLTLGFNAIYAGSLVLNEGLIRGPGTLAAASFDFRHGEASASLEGSVGLQKTSAGTVVLSGANHYAGETVVSGGVLVLRNGAALGSVAGATQVLVGGSLQVEKPAFFGGVVIGEQISLAGAANAGALRNFSGVNSITGPVLLSADATIYADGVASARQSLRLASVGDGSPHVLTVDVESNATVYIDGSLNLGGGRLVKLQPGVLSLSGPNLTTGAGQSDGFGLEVLGGTVAIAHASALGGAAIKVGDAAGGLSGTLAIGPSLALSMAAPLRLDAGLISGGTLTASVYDFRDGTVTASLGGSAGLDKVSDGTVALTGANFYAGVTSVEGGVLRTGSLGLGSSVGPADYTRVGRGGTLEVARAAVIAGEQIYISGDGQAGLGALRTQNVAGSFEISSGLSIEDRFDGIATHARINNQARGYTLTLGSITGSDKDAVFGRLESPGASGGNFRVRGDVNLGAGALIMEGSQKGRDGSIAPSRSSAWSDGSVLRLEGVGHYSGGTEIRSGVIEAAHAQALGGGPIVVGSANRIGSLRTKAALTGLGNLTVVNGLLEGDFPIEAPAVELRQGWVNLALAGAAPVAKTTSGTVELNRASTYSGLTDVAGGILALRHAGSLGVATAGTVVRAGASLRLLQRGLVMSTEPLELNGTGFAAGDGMAGALSSHAPGIRWSAPLSLGSDASIRSYAGTLTLDGTDPIAGGGHNLSLGGPKTISLSKTLDLAGGGLIKEGDGRLVLNKVQTVGAVTHEGGVMDLRGHDLNAGAFLLDGSSAAAALRGYGRINAPVVVDDSPAPATAIVAGLTTSRPSPGLAPLQVGGLSFLDGGKIVVPGIRNFAVAGNPALAGSVESNLGFGPTPLVVNGDLEFMGGASAVQLNLRGSVPWNRTFQVIEYTGGLVGDFAEGSPSSLRVTGVRKGFRQNFAVRNQVNPDDGRQFITFTLAGDALRWQGTSNNRWETTDVNWSLTSAPAGRVNLLTDDAVLFDDAADGVGAVAVRVLPFASSGSRRAVTVEFGNSAAREYTIYRDAFAEGDSPAADAFVRAQQVHVGTSGGTVVLKTRVAIDADDPGEDEPSNGLYLYGGVLRAGHAGALGGRIVELQGGRLTSFGAAAQTFDAAHHLRIAGDDVVFGEAGHAGRLSFLGTVDLSTEDVRVLTVDSTAALGFGADVHGGGILKRGSGRLTLAGANPFEGSVRIEEGVLEVGDGGTGGALLQDIHVVGGPTGSAELVFNRGGALREDATHLVHDADIHAGAGVGADLGRLGGGIRKTGQGRVSITGDSFAAFGVWIDQGNLSLNGARHVGNVTVASGAVLSGAGAVEGAVAILGGGRHEPGNSPGRPVYGSLSYSNGSIVRWELAGNTSAPLLAGQPEGYDQIAVLGNLTFSGNTSLELAFAGTPSAPLVSTVNWADAFWAAGQRWKLFDVAGGVTSGLALAPNNEVQSGLSIVSGDLRDSSGAALASVRAEGFFRLSKEGESVWLNYTPYGSLVTPKPLDLGVAYVGDPFGVGTLTVRNLSGDPAGMSLVNAVAARDVTSATPTVLVPITVPGLGTGAFSVGMDATNAGLNSGSVTVRVTGAFGSAEEQVDVTGIGVQQAVPVVAALDFGSTRLSDPSKAYSASSGTALAHLNQGFGGRRQIQVSNVADAVHGEAMSASLVAPSANAGASPLTIPEILPGSQNGSLWADLNTPDRAGLIQGSVTLRTESIKKYPELPDRPGVVDQAVQLTGTAYYHAFGVLADPADSAIDFGRIRKGAAFAAQIIEVRNDVSPGPFSEKLGARLLGSSGRVILAGALDGLAPGGVDSSSLTVSLDGSQEGRVSGTATVVFATEPVAGSGLSRAEVLRVEIPLVGEVIGPARIDDSAVVSLGRVHENGSFGWAPFPVKNLTVAADYTDDLKADWITSDPGLEKRGPTRISRIAPDATNSSIEVRLADSFAATRGVYTQQVLLEGISVPRDGITPEFSIGNTNLTVEAVVYNGRSTWIGASGAWTDASWSRWAVTEGVPGRDGSLSVNDSATFAGNLGSVRTVDLTGYNPQLAKLIFGGTNGTILRSAGTEEIELGGNGLTGAAEVFFQASTHRVETRINLKQDLWVRADGIQGLFYGAITATDPQAKDVLLTGGGNVGLLTSLSGASWNMNLTLRGPVLLTESQTLDALVLESGEVLSPHLAAERHPAISIAGLAAGQRVLTAASARKTTTDDVRIGVATQEDRRHADPTRFDTLVETIKLTGFGTFAVEAGSLYNNGVIDGGVTVSSGATYGGVGRATGAVRVLAGGRLAPGNSIGWSTVASLNTAPGSVYQVEFNGDAPPDSADRVLIAPGGSVELRGGIELGFHPGVTPQQQSVGQGTVFSIVTFDAGTPVTVALDAAGDTDLTRNGVYFDTLTKDMFPSLDPMIRTLGDRIELYFGLAANFGDARTVSVLPSILGRTANAFTSAIADDPYVRASVRGPSQASGVTGAGLLGAKDTLNQAVTGAAAGSWVIGYAQAVDAKQGERGWDYEYRLGGVAAGLDLSRAQRWVAGLAIGTSQSDSVHEFRGDRTLATAHDVGLYSSSVGNGRTVSFAATLSHYEVSHTRFTPVGVRNLSSVGRFDALRAGVSLGLDAVAHVDADSQSRLMFRLGGGCMRRDAFAEVGDDAVAMNMDAATMAYFELDLGWAYSRRLGEKGGPWSVDAALTLSRRVAGGDISVLGRFNNSVAGGDTPLLAPEYTFTMLRPSLGLSWTRNHGRLSVEASGEVRRGRVAPGLQASFDYRF